MLEEHPGSWLALYCRGINHLHWPRALRHSDDAARDLGRCIELQNASDAGPALAYFVRTHIALGDAYAKDKKYDRARRAWRVGLALFPDEAVLHRRLAIEDDRELLRTIESERALVLPVDTDLSFLDRLEE